MMIKRLGIFYLNDGQGMVDSAAKVLLSSVMPFLDDLIVTASKISEAAKSELKEFSENFIECRQASRLSAYDAGFKLAENVADFDEICFFDASLLGPIYPVNTFFEVAETAESDFFGLYRVHAHSAEPSEQSKYGLKKGKEIPGYLPWSLVVVKKSVFTSDVFKRVLNGAKTEKDEIFATNVLKKAGFLAETYLDTWDLENYTHDLLIDSPLLAVQGKQSPFIPDTVFSRDLGETLETSLGQTVRQAFDYIDGHTTYDVNHIWDRILRTANQHDIKNALGLTYVLPTTYDIPKKSNADALSVALCMHLYYEDLFEYCLAYAKAMPQRTHVIITTSSAEKKDKIEKVFSVLSCASLSVRVIGNRGRDVSSLLIGCKDAIEKYDIICYMHDKKTTQWAPASVGEAFSYQCFENNLSSSHFVNNVLETFAENPRLGIMSPTPPFHAAIYQTLGREWILNFENTVAQAKKHGITVPIEVDKPPMAPLGTMFWFRGKALLGLCNQGLTYEDFPPEPNALNGTVLHAYERLYPYAAQNAGYYPAHLLSQEYGVIQLNAHYHMLLGINRRILNQVGLKREKYTEVIQTLDKNLRAITWERRLEILRQRTPKWVIAPMRALKHLIKR